MNSTYNIFNTVAEFEKFQLAERPYDGATPAYLKDENYQDRVSYTISKGETIVAQGNANNYKMCSKIVIRPKDKILSISDTEFITLVLKPLKRVFNEGNYSLYYNKIICIGDKRRTTHLPAGLIFVLESIKLI